MNRLTNIFLALSLAVISLTSIADESKDSGKVAPVRPAITLPGDHFTPKALPGDQYEPVKLPGDHFAPVTLPGDHFEPALKSPPVDESKVEEPQPANRTTVRSR